MAYQFERKMCKKIREAINKESKGNRQQMS
jgi:hypothetical protein